MKRIINMLLSMIYPALISLFIFCFADAFVPDDAFVTSYHDGILVIAGILAVLFGVAFIAGVVWNIVYSIKHKED